MIVLLLQYLLGNNPRIDGSNCFGLLTRGEIMNVTILPASKKKGEKYVSNSSGR